MDQAVVALANFTLAAAFGRFGGIDAVGVFALVSATVLTGLGLSRILLLDPWLASPLATTALPSPLMRCAGGVAIISAAVSLTLLLLIGRADSVWIIAVPLASLAVAQDLGRYAAFKAERFEVALRSDVVLFAAVVIGLGLASIGERPGVAQVLVAWLAAMVLAVLSSRRLLMSSHSEPGVLQWWRRVCRPLALPLLHDGIAYLVAVNGSLYILAAVGTTSDAGEVRLVSMVFSPVALVFTGLTTWLVPRMARSGVAVNRRLQTRAAGWLTALALPALVLATVFGPAVTAVLLGADESPGRVPFLFAGLATWLSALSTPWIAGARVLGRFQPIAWARTVAAVVAITSLALVPAAASATGYLAISTVLNLLVLLAAVLLTGQRTSSARR